MSKVFLIRACPPPNISPKVDMRRNFQAYFRNCNAPDFMEKNYESLNIVEYSEKLMIERE